MSVGLSVHTVSGTVMHGRQHLRLGSRLVGNKQAYARRWLHLSCASGTVVVDRGMGVHSKMMMMLTQRLASR